MNAWHLRTLISRQRAACDSDAIIEVGAVKFQGDPVLKPSPVSSTRCGRCPPQDPNAHRHRPLSSTRPLRRHCPAQAQHTFIKDYRVVGHTVGFDLDFLRAKRR